VAVDLVDIGRGHMRLAEETGSEAVRRGIDLAEHRIVLAAAGTDRRELLGHVGNRHELEHRIAGCSLVDARLHSSPGCLAVGSRLGVVDNHLGCIPAGLVEGIAGRIAAAGCIGRSRTLLWMW